MPPDLFSYFQPTAKTGGGVRQVRFTPRRSTLAILHRELNGELEARLWAGRHRNFGGCVAHEARAAAITAAIETVMAEQGYPAAEANELIAKARWPPTAPAAPYLIQPPGSLA